MPWGLPPQFDTPANNAKMERCVAHVMAQGKDKGSAAAICKDALGFTNAAAAAPGNTTSP